MLNKDKEIKVDLLNNYYAFSNNNIKRKYEMKKDKKGLNPKVNSNFKKVTGSGNINTSGSTPIVMFKKSSTKKNNNSANDLNQINSKSINNNQKNEYISDGGLSKKLQKNNNNNININNINNNMNNIYFNNYINEKSQQYPNNKNIKNNLDNINNNNTNTNINNNIKKNKEQQHIFSKTVRGFNKRPDIHKNEKQKELVSVTKNSSGVNKLKNKSANQNMNTGNNTSKNNRQNKKSNSEDSKVQEDKKLIIMKQLVENGVVNEIKKLQNKKKSTQKEKNEERKREILENHGLPIDLSDEEEEEKKESNKNINNKINNNEEEEKNTDTNNNTNKMKDLNKKFLSKTTRGFYPKINNYMFSLDENYNSNEEKPYPLKAKKLKPSVNPFEFINRINNEKKKLNINSQFSPQHININHSENIFQRKKIKSVNSELNDSFRHKNSRDKNNNIYFNKNIKLKNKSCNNELNKKSIDDFQDEFPFAHKKNHRSSEEIKKFVKEKKIKNKKKEEDILLEKNKKLFLLFKNLYNLNMKDFSKGTPTLTSEHFYSKSNHQPTISSRGKAVMPSKNNFNNNYLNKVDSNNANNNIRKKKEINEYYIGNESTIKNNNSTLIDPNEYYLNVLESQQLFVNSGLNKIENDSLTSEENNTNDLNVSKEQIQKITTKESKKSNSKEKKNNNLILNTNEYDDLKKRIDNTLKRAGKMFSNKDNDKEQPTTEDKKVEIEI